MYDQRHDRALSAAEIAIVLALVVVVAMIGVYYVQVHVWKKRIQQTRSNLRMLSVAAEAYCVDWSTYPAPVEYVLADRPGAASSGGFASLSRDEKIARLGLGNPDAHGHYSHLAWAFWPVCVTTPVAYVTRVPEDPFRSVGDRSYGYMVCGRELPRGYILVGCGPDGDRDVPLYSFDTRGVTESRDVRDFFFERAFPQPLPTYFYDPTNGLRSDGDIVRVKP